MDGVFCQWNCIKTALNTIESELIFNVLRNMKPTEYDRKSIHDLSTNHRKIFGYNIEYDWKLI